MDLFTAKKLTALRKHFSLSQEALAEKVGVSRQAISKWERGEASPDTDNLLTLSKLYSVSLDDLLGDKTAEEIIEGITCAKEEKTDIPFEENFDDENGIPFSKKMHEPKNFYSNKNHTQKKTEEKGEEKNLPELGKKLLRIPYFLIAIIVFLILGFTSKLWHPSWMIFLTIPTYYLTAWAFCSSTKKKMLLKLPIYLYTVILYLLMGFTASLWHPMWMLFLIIPAYYWYVSFMKK